MGAELNSDGFGVFLLVINKMSAKNRCGHRMASPVGMKKHENRHSFQI